MISFEKILRWKGFPLGEARELVKNFDSLSEPRRSQWIEDRKRKIVEYHLDNNSFYKKRVGAKLFENWNSLPILKKKDFQQPLQELLSKPFTVKNIYVSNTSGSSGHPFFFGRDKFSHALIWAFILQTYERLGITSGSMQARFYGIPLQGVSYYSELFKDFLMRRKRFVVFDLSDRVLEKFLTTFRTISFDYVYGYTNSMLIFARYLQQRGIILKQECPTLMQCIATSEVCTEEDRFFLQKTFGVPVIREYGASELDVLAIEDASQRWSLNESNLFVEVLDEHDNPLPEGEEGRLIVTSLFNKAMPFIRYEVGDLGIIGRDEQGRYLKQLSGRTNDTIILPSGKRSPGFTFYYISRNVLESHGIFKEFIIRQTSLDLFEFDAVLSRPLEEEDFAAIRTIMDKYLEPGLKLRINRVEKIQRPASGKIKHFYSELKV